MCVLKKFGFVKGFKKMDTNRIEKPGIVRYQWW